MIGTLVNIFDTIAELGVVVAKGFMTIIDSITHMYAWFPQLSSFISGSASMFVPLAFHTVIGVLFVIFLLKLVAGAIL